MPWDSAGGVDLAPFREWPLTPFGDAASGEDGPPAREEGRLFFSGPGRVFCRDLGTGREVWCATCLMMPSSAASPATG